MTALRKNHHPHAPAADKLRNNPGIWYLIGSYRAKYSAESFTKRIRAGLVPAYTPAAAFETRVEDVGDDTGVDARYTAAQVPLTPTERLNRVLAECDAIEAEANGQHDEVAIGARAAVIRIRAAAEAIQESA